MNCAPAFHFFPKDWLDFLVQRMNLEARRLPQGSLCALCPFYHPHFEGVLL